MSKAPVTAGASSYNGNRSEELCTTSWAIEHQWRAPLGHHGAEFVGALLAHDPVLGPTSGCREDGTDCGSGWHDTQRYSGRVSVESVIAACYVKACAPPPVGSGGSAGAKARALAKHLVDRAKRLDKGDKITSTLRRVIERTDVSGRIVKAKYKYKGVGSLTRKIHDKAREKGVSEPVQAHGIDDALRFTALFNRGEYAESTNKLIGKLKDEGYDIIEVENKWDDASDYKGIHIIARSPTGQRFELQAHTHTSFRLQGQLHTIYEKTRTNPPPPPAELKALLAESYRLGRQNPVASVPNVLSVKSVARVKS